MASQTNHGKPRTYFANNARVAKTQREIEKVMSQIQFRSSCKGRMNAKLTTETNSQRVFAARNLKSTPRLDMLAATSRHYKSNEYRIYEKRNYCWQCSSRTQPRIQQSAHAFKEQATQASSNFDF